MKQKHQGKQTKGTSTNQNPAASGGSVPVPKDTTKGGAGQVAPAQEEDYGRGAVDHHQGSHGRRGR